MPASVRFFVDLVEVGNHVFEFRCREEQESAGVAADFVEHVCDIKKEEYAFNRLHVFVGCVDE